MRNNEYLLPGFERLENLHDKCFLPKNSLYTVVEQKLSAAGWLTGIFNASFDNPKSFRDAYLVAGRVVDRVDLTNDSFSSLVSVRAMGSGIEQHCIGLDTEFVCSCGHDSEAEHDPTKCKRDILSYQFSTPLLDDSSKLAEIVVFPLLGQRIELKDALFLIALLCGLDKLSSKCWDDQRCAVSKTSYRDGEWCLDADGKPLTGDALSIALQRHLYKNYGVNLTLAGHYLNADLTAFREPYAMDGYDTKWVDVRRRVISAGGGLISMKPFRVKRYSRNHRWVSPFSITVRDTMTHAPAGSRSLDVLGEACGVSKLDVSKSEKSCMDKLLFEDPVLFAEYAARDATIVVEYLARVWGDGVLPPATLSSGAANAAKFSAAEYLGCIGGSGRNPVDGKLFRQQFCGLRDHEGGNFYEVSNKVLAYYKQRDRVPVDGDAENFLWAAAQAYHGGLNNCLWVGYRDEWETYDVDVKNAYPTAMSLLLDVDYGGDGCIESVIKNRELTESDFEHGYLTPLFAYCRFEFPDYVEPCLPLRYGGGPVFVTSSKGYFKALGSAGVNDFDGAWFCAPELLLALKLGAKIYCQIGYIGRLRESEHCDDFECKNLDCVGDGESRSLRYAVRNLISDRSKAKELFGKGSIEEQTLKTAVNSVYGKLAQNVSSQRSWDAFEQIREEVGGSAITSPYYAAMTTSLIRALLFAVMNAMPGNVYSVTTDGFICDFPAEVIETLDLYGLTKLFKSGRVALTGDEQLWEDKHVNPSFYSISTRGNVSLDNDGVLAHMGFKTPDSIERDSLEDRAWFHDVMLKRTGKIENAVLVFPSFYELSVKGSKRSDFIVTELERSLRGDFDLKRRPVIDGYDFENHNTMYSKTVTCIDGEKVVIACFRTIPWKTVSEYALAREISNTLGRTACLKTCDDWMVWLARFSGLSHAVNIDDEYAKITFALHKAGIDPIVDVTVDELSVDETIALVNELYGCATDKTVWNNLSKPKRREKIIEMYKNGKLNDLGYIPINCFNSSSEI